MISVLDAATQGVGLYSVTEAARYAKMPANTIRGWFFPSRRKPMRRGDIESDEEKALSFLDFVEAIAVRSLRVDYRVSLNTIRKAIDFAQEQYQKDHIFAREDHTTLIDPKRQLHITFPGEKSPIKMGGKDAGQMTLETCVEGYMRDLKFNRQKIAAIYTAFEYGGQRVVMNPAFRFGEPVMEENGYPANVLWRGVIGEGGFARAAKLYGTSIESVEAAYRYCNGELQMAA
jgi:uncharacterized protein (DUF433 family)